MAIGKGEDELRQLAVEVQVLEQTAATLQERMHMVNAIITDLSISSLALEGIGKEKEGSEILVPIGASSYVRAKLGLIDKVIVGVGAGVSVEKSVDEAKEIVKQRLEELQKTRVSIQQQFSQVAERINSDRQRFDELAAELRQGKPQPNV